MTPPTDPRITLVHNWLKVAEEDLAAARASLKNSDVARRIVAYHAQQSAEKFIKAALVWGQVEFRKRHELAYLRALLRGAAPSLAGSLEFADDLTQYGTAGRYPDDLEPVSAAEARRAVSLATRVRSLVRKHLKTILPAVVRSKPRRKLR